MRLQLLMDRRTKAMTALSNLIKKIEETSSSIVLNLKSASRGSIIETKRLQSPAALYEVSPVKWNILVAYGLIVGAVFFAFKF